MKLAVAHDAQVQPVLVEQLRALTPRHLAAFMLGAAADLGHRFDFERLGRHLAALPDDELAALCAPKRRGR